MLSLRFLATVAVVLIAQAAIAQTHVVRGERAGWMLPDDYAPPDRTASAFYPSTQTQQQWTERLRVFSVTDLSVADADGFLDSRAAAYRHNCPDLRTQTIYAKTVDGYDNAVQMWHCPQQSDERLGRVILNKAIIDGATIFVAEASARYPAFVDGSSPLAWDTLQKWAGFHNSFILCVSRLNPSCLPEPALLMHASQAALTTGEQVAVDIAQARGALMFRKDRLAWQATEILGAQTTMRYKNRIKGWVTVLDENDTDVVWFMGGNRNRPRPYYAVVFDRKGNAEFFLHTEYRASEQAIAMFRARESALADMRQACTPNVNTVVLKDEDADGWLVYVLSAGTGEDDVYIGGHTRFTVDADGGNVLRQEALAESCLVLKKNPPQAAAGEVPAWFSMTHLRDSTPLETHLFQSLNHDVLFFVHTSEGDWRVQGGTITKLLL